MKKMAVATLSSHPWRERAQCALVFTLVVLVCCRRSGLIDGSVMEQKTKNLIVAKAYDEEKE